MNSTATTIAEGIRDLRKANLKRLSDLQALLHLAAVEDDSASNIAQAAGITPASATELVDRLANAGLVIRQNSAIDRRLVISAITAKGRKLVTPFLP